MDRIIGSFEWVLIRYGIAEVSLKGRAGGITQSYDAIAEHVEADGAGGERYFDAHRDGLP